MAYLRSRLALALFLSKLLWSATAPAQLLPAAPDTPEAPEASETQTATGQENARVLAEILQDEQARQALIDQLLQGGVASGAAGGAVDPDDDVTIAREAAESLGEVTGEVTDWVARLRAA